MMRITTKLATYLMAAATAVETGKITDRAYLTNICPECNDTIDLFDEVHLVIADDTPGRAAGSAFILVACEGYTVINPALIGLTGRMWEDWTMLPDDVTPDDFAG